MGLLPNVFTLSSVLSACQSAQQWRVAVQHMMHGKIGFNQLDKAENRQNDDLEMKEDSSNNMMELEVGPWN